MGETRDPGELRDAQAIVSTIAPDKIRKVDREVKETR
jgi:hypothetical protein